MKPLQDAPELGVQEADEARLLPVLEADAVPPAALPAALPAVASAAPQYALTVPLPSLGNLDAYIAAVHRLPMLSAQEEAELARRLREQGDLQAASALVLSHLRLVVAVSKRYMGYGLPLADLIQEGNLGLMRAVKRFDPDRGARLVTYAMHWIRAFIHEYILKNWRMVKIATTQAQRKLFFGLRSAYARIKGGDSLDSEPGLPEVNLDAGRESLSQSEVRALAQHFRVKDTEIIEMQARMSGGDVALEPAQDDEERAYAPIDYLADETSEPLKRIEAAQQERAVQGLSAALSTLDARSQHIIQERWLNLTETGQPAKTLHELGAELKISYERVRQIETAALKKMRKAMQEGRVPQAAAA